MAGDKKGRIDNLKGHKFPKAPQGLDDKKSKGQINLAKNNNIICTARTLFEASEILPELINNIQEEVQNGLNKNALELLKIIKEPEQQNIKIDGGAVVQKVFVTEKELKEVREHIASVVKPRKKK